MEKSLSELAQEALSGLVALRDEALAAETGYNWGLEGLAEFPDRLSSARNLVHCVLLRAGGDDVLGQLLKQLCIDVGSHETHNLGAVETAIQMCSAVCGMAAPPTLRAPLSREEGKRLLLERKAAIFGPCHPNRYQAVMVTLDPPAATVAMLTQLLQNGMDVARLNTAHDSVTEWRALLGRLRQAEDALGRSGDRCRLHVDLAGPKLRSLPIVASVVKKFKPTRNERGAAVEAVMITLVAGAESAPDSGCVAVREEQFISRALLSDTVRLKDVRGKVRHGTVAAATLTSVSVELRDTCYLTEGVKVRLLRGKKERARSKLGRILAVMPVELQVGCELSLVDSRDPGSAEKRRIPVDLGGAKLSVGDCVLLDDGAVSARVVEVKCCGEEKGVRCVVEVCPRGFKLKAEKGINLPDSVFPADCSALTAEDESNLTAVLEMINIAERPLTVGLSFVRSETDVSLLCKALQQRGADASRVSLCVKIETRAALLALPLVLLACLSCPYPASVMLARGDLAAEIGFAQLSAAMDDVVTLAAAAHLPVVFATQVLETLAKTGTPSRSEMSDVTAASKCECVMLNKGAHLTDAVAFLARLLEKQQHRNHKHRLMLRQLSSIDLPRFVPARKS
jgi:pyruvate kinase